MTRLHIPIAHYNTLYTYIANGAYTELIGLLFRNYHYRLHNILWPDQSIRAASGVKNYFSAVINIAFYCVLLPFDQLRRATYKSHGSPLRAYTSVNRA